MKPYPSKGCCSWVSQIVIAGLVPLLSGLRSASGKVGCHRVCSSPPSHPPPVKGGGDFLSRFNNFPLPLRRGRDGVGVTPSPPQAVHHGALGFLSSHQPLALMPCKTTLSDKRKKPKPDSSGLVPAIHRGSGLGLSMDPHEKPKGDKPEGDDLGGASFGYPLKSDGSVRGRLLVLEGAAGQPAEAACRMRHV